MLTEAELYNYLSAVFCGSVTAIIHARKLKIEQEQRELRRDELSRLMARNIEPAPDPERERAEREYEGWMKER